MTDEKPKSDEKLHALLVSIRNRLRITKVVATRAVKSPVGDSFAGFAAAWQSVQEDPGAAGSELIGTMGDSSAPQGMTLHEARIAHLLLAMQADIAATEAAMASGGVSPERCKELIQMYKHNYAKLIRQATKTGEFADE